MFKKSIEESKINEKKNNEFKKKKKKQRGRDEKQELQHEKKDELWNYETKLLEKLLIQLMLLISLNLKFIEYLTLEIQYIEMEESLSLEEL